MPRLIAIELDRAAPPDLDAVRRVLTQQFKGVTLDDHRWQQQIRTITRSFALGGLAILLLVGAATTAIIVSATKSAMASNREIVEVLHFVGATDRFIAREFERHFLRLGVCRHCRCNLGDVRVSGDAHGHGAVGRRRGDQAEICRLIGISALDAMGYFLLGIVVLVIARMLTSRIGVYRILKH